MIGSISGRFSYFNMYQYRSMMQRPSEQAGQIQSAGRVSTVAAAGRTVSPDVPVQPVEAAPVVHSGVSSEAGQVIPFLRQGADPAELAVRMRMVPYDPTGEAAAVPGLSDEEGGKCQTCEERKYQDGSDDPGVSFKTAAHIAPEQAASVVRGHEMEHVVREQAKAEREDREVVSQNVSLHTSVCPECGKVYVSGGTTTTTTVSASEPKQGADAAQRKPFFAVA